jgi:nucleotide-binding universal stress UspA family protein
MDLFGAELVIIHIGEKKEHKLNQIEGLLVQCNIDPDETKLILEEEQEGTETATQILEICHQYQIDLLIAGALQEETILSKYFAGTIARKFLREAKISILILLEPQKYCKDITHITLYDHPTPHPFTPFTNIVETLSWMSYLKRIDFFVPIVRVSWFTKNFGWLYLKPRKGMSIQRLFINRKLNQKKAQLKEVNPDTKIVIHAAVDHPVERVSEYAHDKKTDLLVMRAPDLRKTWRNYFSNRDFEKLLSNLPSNVLFLRNK